MLLPVPPLLLWISGLLCFRSSLFLSQVLRSGLALSVFDLIFLFVLPELAALLAKATF